MMRADEKVGSKVYTLPAFRRAQDDAHVRWLHRQNILQQQHLNLAGRAIIEILCESMSVEAIALQYLTYRRRFCDGLI